MPTHADRFTNRADDYAKYRPSYPRGVVDTLINQCGLTSESVVADIGSGTGIFSRLLLETGATVYAIEPNADMRTAAESATGERSNFHSLSSTAEDTRLQAASVDIITIAQAFHWFDFDKCYHEFRRILKPGGFLAIIWNERRTDAGFMAAYEALLEKYAETYSESNYRNVTPSMIADFYAPGSYQTASFPYHQDLTFEAKRGRLMSTSYAPRPGHPTYEPMIRDLKTAFDAHARDGIVLFEYDTVIYYGRLDPPG